jgi:hypothetical protein
MNSEKFIIEYSLVKFVARRDYIERAMRVKTKKNAKETTETTTIEIMGKMKDKN